LRPDVGAESPVRVISIDGSFRVFRPADRKAVAPFAHEGFMSANLADIQRAVETLPWVDHARIARAGRTACASR